MALTHEELKERIINQLDPEFIVDLLEITIEQLVDRIGDLLEIPRNHKLLEEMFEEDEYNA